jgi:TnpA family transposase
VLDGILYHESCLVIDEHYTDTGGFSDAARSKARYIWLCACQQRSNAYKCSVFLCLMIARFVDL